MKISILATSYKYIHTGEKLHHFNIHGRSFFIDYNLTIHKYIHAGDHITVISVKGEDLSALVAVVLLPQHYTITTFIQYIKPR
ncbi:Hypothetical predicted protein [Octopus vulgaris]|uniref:Uncharacterized protein n=1 Tax=Octopus vulgaris TaxID=6645 RepID=A0AA36FBV4_OCTVU|nr:Hypothetical predicted protein [Octopus vulgaris]